MTLAPTPSSSMPTLQRRRSRLGRIVAATSTAALGLGLMIGTGGTAHAATNAVPAAATNAIAVLMKTKSPDTGRIGAMWWTSGVALSSVMEYQVNTGDKQFESAATDAFAKNKNWTNEFIDDTGWWSLAWQRAYDATGDPKYLAASETTADYMHNYWDSTCGGGVYWSTDKKYKASIANELFLATTAGLHNRIPGDTKYLGWANAEWNWFKNSGLIKDNLPQDGFVVPGCSTHTAQITYNAGVTIGGLTELSKATNNPSLITTAETIATAGTKRWNKNGVEFSGCEPNCNGDGTAFNGIWMRYLGVLAKTADTTQYDTYLQTTANSIIKNDTNGSGQLGNSYVGPFANWSKDSQVGSIEALVAALPHTGDPVKTPPVTTPVTTPATTPPAAAAPPATGGTSTPTTPAKPVGPGTVKPGTITSGIPGKCLDNRGASKVSGNAIELWSCNGTAAQIFKAQSDGTLRIENKCVDAMGAQTGNFTKVILWDCHNGKNQVWQAYDGGYRNPVSGRCLDDPGAGVTDGIQLELFDCNGTNAQKWTAPVA